jgi:hypothetical protein
MHDDYQEQIEIVEMLDKNYKEIEYRLKTLSQSYKEARILVNGEIESENIIEFGDTLSKVLTNKLKRIKIYVNEIDSNEEIAIDNN